jgi:hypothetical protein
MQSHTDTDARRSERAEPSGERDDFRDVDLLLAGWPLRRENA